MKICKKCQLEKPDDAFSTINEKYLYPNCKLCHNLNMKERRQERYEYINSKKLGKPCVIYPPCAMDFDHVLGTKLFGVTRGKFTSFVKIDAEIEKCVIRCANCHRVRSHGCKNDLSDAFVEVA